MSSSALRILLVEDDLSLARSVSDYLTRHGVSATLAHDLESVRQLLSQHQFDAIVLDLTLNHEDALSFARELIADGGPPILMASGRSEELDRVLGLEMGADDYLTKPYSFRELLVRLRMIVRRRDTPHTRVRKVAIFDRWTVDLSARTVINDEGVRAELTGGEFSLLEAFLKEPNRVLSRSELMTMSLRDDEKVFERVIDVTVGRLRGKLERSATDPTLIQTVRGSGYRLCTPVRWESGRD